jgi:hypothetical protein
VNEFYENVFIPRIRGIPHRGLFQNIASKKKYFLENPLSGKSKIRQVHYMIVRDN